MTIGAASEEGGGIARIDPDRTALGQFPAKDLVFGNVWQYYSENGPTRYQNLIKGGGTDPTITYGSDTTAKLNLGAAYEGFSQAFSPTTARSVGVTGFIPVVADVLILNEAGNTERRRVDTYFQSDSGTLYWPDNDNRPFVPVGNQWKLFIGHTIEQLATNDTAGIARQDALRASASQVDDGTIFKALKP